MFQETIVIFLVIVIKRGKPYMEEGFRNQHQIVFIWGGW